MKVYTISFQIKRIKIKFKMKCNFQMSEAKLCHFLIHKMEGIVLPCVGQERGSAPAECNDDASLTRSCLRHQNFGSHRLSCSGNFTVEENVHKDLK